MTTNTPMAPTIATMVVAIPSWRERIHPPKPKLASKRKTPLRNSKDSNGICEVISLGSDAPTAKPAARDVANVVPNVTSKNVIEAVTLRKAAQLVVRWGVGAKSNVP